MTFSDPQPPGLPTHDLAYDGRQGRIFRIALVNALLTIPTLGLYRFWGTTRMRRYVWSRILLDGDRLDYTGTARELFLGFLIVVAALLPFQLVVGFVESLQTSGSVRQSAILQAVLTLLFWYLVLAALYRARRYRLSRTEWRGVRGGQTGSSLRYAAIGMGWWFVTILTLGLATPVRRVRMAAFRTNNTWFGDRRFLFDATARDIYRPWLVNWLLFVPTLGVSYFWYRAAEARYFASRTRYESLRFRSSLTGGRLAGIFLPYVLSLLVLVGLWVGGMFMFVAEFRDTGNAPAMTALRVGAPLVLLLLLFVIKPMLYYGLVLHRLVKALVGTMAIEGWFDPQLITQAQTRGPSRGEGLAAALSVGEF